MNRVFSPSFWVEHLRPLLPVAQGLEVIDPLRDLPVIMADHDFEVLYVQNEQLGNPAKREVNLSAEILAHLGPMPGEATSVLVRSKPWRLRCQHSQIFRQSRTVLHDPTTDWLGV
jgi:hypothetical protein